MHKHVLFKKDVFVVCISSSIRTKICISFKQKPTITPHGISSAGEVPITPTTTYSYNPLKFGSTYPSIASSDAITLAAIRPRPCNWIKSWDADGSGSLCGVAVSCRLPTSIKGLFPDPIAKNLSLSTYYHWFKEIKTKKSIKYLFLIYMNPIDWHGVLYSCKFKELCSCDQQRRKKITVRSWHNSWSTIVFLRFVLFLFLSFSNPSSHILQMFSHAFNHSFFFLCVCVCVCVCGWGVLHRHEKRISRLINTKAFHTLSYSWIAFFFLKKRKKRTCEGLFFFPSLDMRRIEILARVLFSKIFDSFNQSSISYVFSVQIVRL